MNLTSAVSLRNLQPRVAAAQLLFVLPLLLGAFVANGQEPDWRFAYPYPQGNELRASWASSPNDLFVGGDGGTIHHWDGSQWSAMDVPSTKRVESISGTGPSDVWAVGGIDSTADIGGRSLVAHYNGSEWSNVTPPDFSGWTYPLQGLTAITTNNVWATNNGGPSLVHWNGTNWSFDLLPLLVEGRFYDTFALGSDHVFAVGSHGQIVHRYDNAWHLEIKTETGNFSTNLLTGIWGTDLENLYAVGNWGQVYKRSANGTWRELSDVFPSSFGNGFIDITGTSATDIYLIRTQGVVHYDGDQTKTEINFTPSMRSQWFASAGVWDGVFLAGSKGVVHKYVYPTQQTQGSLWTMTAGGPEFGFWNPALASCGQDGVLIFGWGQQGPPTFEPLMYFDGSIPMRFPQIPAQVWKAQLSYSVAARSIDDVVVGGSTNQGATFSMRWDGQSWSSLPLMNHKTLWFSPGGTLYGATTYSVNKLQDNVWVPVLNFSGLPPDSWINCLWGRNDNEIYIGLSGGQIMLYNGASWATHTTGTTSGVKAISGDATNTYAIGENGLALRRSGNSWSSLTGIDYEQGQTFLTLCPAANQGVYASMQLYRGGGRLYHFSGTIVTRVMDNETYAISSMARTGSGHLYALTTDGAMMTTEPLPSTLKAGLIDTGGTGWISLPEGPLSFQFAGDKPGNMYVATWRTDRAPGMFAPAELPDATPAGQQWVLLHDRNYQGVVQAEARIQVEYDPTKLPEGMTPGMLALYGQNGTGWLARTSTVDADNNQIQTDDLGLCTVWTISQSPTYEPPLNPKSLLLLFQDMGEGQQNSLDLFRRLLTWMLPE